MRFLERERGIFKSQSEHYHEPNDIRSTGKNRTLFALPSSCMTSPQIHQKPQKLNILNT